MKIFVITAGLAQCLAVAPALAQTPFAQDPAPAPGLNLSFFQDTPVADQFLSLSQVDSTFGDGAAPKSKPAKPDAPAVEQNNPPPRQSASASAEPGPEPQASALSGDGVSHKSKPAKPGAFAVRQNKSPLRQNASASTEPELDDPDQADEVVNPPLTNKERQGVVYGFEWSNNRDRPARGPDGGAIYVFGATLPTVVCAPLYVCDMVLQEGEAVRSVNVGDAVRWQISPAEQGAGESQITHVIIKPTDVGLVTNMVITTNRRAYVVKLLSRKKEWMPIISFKYPDDARSDWRAHRIRADREKEAREAEAAAKPQGALDYGYRLGGDAPSWRPVKVYASQNKTYIQFPATLPQGEAPTLLAVADDTSFLEFDTFFNGPKREIVNYRLLGDRIEVDKVLDHAVLVSGVGSSQAAVEIVRERGRRQ